MKEERREEKRKHANVGREAKRRGKGARRKVRKVRRAKSHVGPGYRNIYKLSSGIISLAAVDPFNVTVAKFNLIDRSPRSFITSSKLHR